MTPQIGRPVQYRDTHGTTLPAMTRRVDSSTQLDLVVFQGESFGWKSILDVQQSVGLTANNSWDYIPD